jgi:8-oxo-dGTP diphosphatase
MEGIKKAAVFCILQCEHQFLLLERNKDPNQGKMVPVGGKIDPFETPLQAVIRETKEETGLNIVNPIFCGILTETSPSKYNWISYIYTTQIEFVPAPTCDEGTLHWVDIKNIHTLNTPPTDMSIYTYVAEGKKFILDATYDKDMNMVSLYEELQGLQIK